MSALSYVYHTTKLKKKNKKNKKQKGNKQTKQPLPPKKKNTSQKIT